MQNNFDWLLQEADDTTEVAKRLVDRMEEMTPEQMVTFADELRSACAGEESDKRWDQVRKVQEEACKDPRYKTALLAAFEYKREQRRLAEEAELEKETESHDDDGA